MDFGAFGGETFYAYTFCCGVRARPFGDVQVVYKVWSDEVFHVAPEGRDFRLRRVVQRRRGDYEERAGIGRVLQHDGCGATANW